MKYSSVDLTESCVSCLVECDGGVMGGCWSVMGKVLECNGSVGVWWGVLECAYNTPALYYGTCGA